jgi:UDP-2-acetamido-2,6-beta-L-arabino-hexul-4-ose reductase
MKIAITGETGFLGYHLTQYYTRNGYDVIKLGRNYTENLQLARDCDFIIHAAGIGKTFSEEEIYKVNVELAYMLVNKLLELGIQMNLKFISSIQENDGSAYGRSKIKAKEILSDYCKQSNTILESYNLPNLFGTHGKPNYASFINTFAYNIVNGFECNYNKNEINICWVYDAIEVIDNQVSSYKLHKTTVESIYQSLLGIAQNTADIPDKEVITKLEQIINYYKQ